MFFLFWDSSFKNSKIQESGAKKVKEREESKRKKKVRKNSTDKFLKTRFHLHDTFSFVYHQFCSENKNRLEQKRIERKVGTRERRTDVKFSFFFLIIFHLLFFTLLLLSLSLSFLFSFSSFLFLFPSIFLFSFSPQSLRFFLNTWASIQDSGTKDAERTMIRTCSNLQVLTWEQF